MKNSIKLDLEDLSAILEALAKRLPDMKRAERIDVAARVSSVRKNAEAIEGAVKDEVKDHLDGKEGIVKGEVFNAKLTLVPTTRLDQTMLKEEYPKEREACMTKMQDKRVTFEVR